MIAVGVLSGSNASRAEWAKVVFSQCFNYEPSDPEMFSDKFGHGFSSFFEDVEQYELTVPEVTNSCVSRHASFLCRRCIDTGTAWDYRI